MNTNELNFAYRVRHALNENLDHLPSDTVSRLAASRNSALARKKQSAPLSIIVVQRALAGQAGKLFDTRASWLARLGLVIPLLVVCIGLAGLVEMEEQQRVTETADIDAEVLAGELPLDAYLDSGFNAFLAKRTERE